MRRWLNLLLVGFVCLVWLGTPAVYALYPQAHGGTQRFCASDDLRSWQPPPQAVTYEWADAAFSSFDVSYGRSAVESMHFTVPVQLSPSASLTWVALALLWWGGFALQIIQLWLRLSDGQRTGASRVLARSPLLAATGLTALWWPLAMPFFGPIVLRCFSPMMPLWGRPSLAVEAARADLPATVSPTVVPHAAFAPLALATVVTIFLLLLAAWRQGRRPVAAGKEDTPGASGW